MQSPFNGVSRALVPPVPLVNSPKIRIVRSRIDWLRSRKPKSFGRRQLVLAGVVVAMAMLGLIATWIPVRRALSIDPMVLLREE